MMLDTGKCTIYKIQNTAEPGDMPIDTLVEITECWFGDLSFESSPSQHTESLEQIEIARRIRILQNREIAQKAVVVIGDDQYQIERVFHGQDAMQSYFSRGMIYDGSGELITDLSLSRVVIAYDVSTTKDSPVID